MVSIRLYLFFRVTSWWGRNVICRRWTWQCMDLIISCLFLCSHVHNWDPEFYPTIRYWTFGTRGIGWPWPQTHRGIRSRWKNQGLHQISSFLHGKIQSKKLIFESWYRNWNQFKKWLHARKRTSLLLQPPSSQGKISEQTGREISLWGASSL